VIKTEVEIDKIRYIKELYPRQGIDEEAIKRYRTALDKLPPIVISKEYILVDGYHRLIAHKIEGRTRIEAEILDIDKDKILIEAIKRNATHGKQLTYEEKKWLARRLYEEHHGELTQKEIAEILAVGNSTVSSWCSDINHKKREERKQKAIELYLDYLSYPTQEEVAKALDITQKTVSNYIQNFKNELISNPPPDSLQLYNVWRFQQCDPRYGMDYPGRIPGQIVENLLWYYTEPFDLVVDPMAGGGTTVDVCKAMYRRYAAFDINPIEEKGIRKNDVRDGIPLANSETDLIFLDPPYWRLQRDFYIEKSISSGSYEEWCDFMKKLANECYRVVKKGGHVALLVEAFLDEKETGEFLDLPCDCKRWFEDAGFKQVHKISVPLTSEIKSARDVEYAKRKRIMLDLDRDLRIFKKI